MKILIACECSGKVRDAFIAKGHNAISCDLKESQRPGPHYKGDVRDIICEDWDMMIAHPVCRYMANSGVRWLHERPDRWEKMKKGVEFFMLFENAKHIPKRAIENPILHRYAIELIGRKANQFVHPWWFGEPYSKATGLWLTGLDPLPKEREKTSYDKIIHKCHNEPPGPLREEKRSETYDSIANAFAKYWG